MTVWTKFITCNLVQFLLHLNLLEQFHNGLTFISQKPTLPMPHQLKELPVELPQVISMLLIVQPNLLMIVQVNKFLTGSQMLLPLQYQQLKESLPMLVIIKILLKFIQVLVLFPNLPLNSHSEEVMHLISSPFQQNQKVKSLLNLRKYVLLPKQVLHQEDIF